MLKEASHYCVSVPVLTLGILDIPGAYIEWICA